MTINEQIKAAQAEVERCERALSESRAALDALYVQRSSQKFGIAPGMYVTARGDVFIVDTIQPRSWGDKPWLDGRKIKKDGTPGGQRRTIFGDWTICDANAAHGHAEPEKQT